MHWCHVSDVLCVFPPSAAPPSAGPPFYWWLLGSKRAHFPTLQTQPKIQREDTQRDTKRAKMGRESEKKNEILGLPHPSGQLPFGPLPGGVSRGGGGGGRDLSTKRAVFRDLQIQVLPQN